MDSQIATDAQEKDIKESGQCDSVTSAVTRSSDEAVKHKVVIIGRSNVGKSCLFLRYAIYSQADSEDAISITQNHSFNASTFTKRLQSGDQSVEVEVWDFHNPEDSVYGTQSSHGAFNVMEEHREEVLSADTVVLVYQKNSKESKQYCQDVVQLLSQEQRVLIVTNKCDLVDHHSSQKSPTNRQLPDRNLFDSVISTGGRASFKFNVESNQYGSVLQNRKYFRVSSKSGMSLAQLFSELDYGAAPLLSTRPPQPSVPDFETPFLQREQAMSSRLNSHRDYTSQQEKLCLQVAFLCHKIDVRFPKLDGQNCQYKIRNGREIHEFRQFKNVQQLQDLKKQVRSTRQTLEQWLNKIVAKNLISSFEFVDGQRKEAELAQFERDIEKKIKAFQKSEKRINNLSKCLFCLIIVSLIAYVSVFEAKIDSFWQLNAGVAENSLLRYERKRVNDALAEIKKHQQLLITYRANVKENLDRLEEHQNSKIIDLKKQVEALESTILNKMSLVKSRYHYPAYMKESLMQYKMIETRLSTMHIVSAHQTSVNIVMATRTIFEYEKLLLNIKEEALDLYDSVTLITKAITDYALVYKKENDPNAEQWLEKQHREFNQKIQAMVIDFREDMNQSQNLALKLGALAFPMKAALEKLNDREPVKDLAKVDQKYLRYQCEIACSIFETPECAVLKKEEKQQSLRIQRKLADNLDNRLAAGLRPSHSPLYQMPSTFLAAAPPTNLIGKLHHLQKATEDLVTLAVTHLSKISSLDYKGLPSIRGATTPAERSLLEEYTESVCYGYQEYGRIVSGMQERKENLETIQLLLLILIPLFCIIEYCRRQRSKLVLEYTFRKNELENAVIYNYYDPGEDQQDEEDNHDEELAKVKVVEADDNDVAPLMRQIGQSSPLSLRKDLIKKARDDHNDMIKLQPVAEEQQNQIDEKKGEVAISLVPGAPGAQRQTDSVMITPYDTPKESQNTGEEMDELGREGISQLMPTLPNLISVLTKIFPKLDAVKNSDLVICIGNTGCGKSTTLNSLVHGTDSLHLVLREHFVNVNGQPKKKVMKVIDTKPEIDTSIKIGHNASTSETFIPNIVKDDQQSTVFVDPAGFSDTSGDFINLVNSFMHRYMFLQAAKVRFLLLITVQSINEARGADVKKQFDQLTRMCSVSLRESCQAIQPILSKIKPMDEVDLEQIKDILYTQLCNFATDGQTYDLDGSLQSDRSGNSDSIKSATKKETEYSIDFPQTPTGQQTFFAPTPTPNITPTAAQAQQAHALPYDLFDFNYDISQKLEIYDPLGREIPTAEPQSITRSNLLSLINGKLVPVPGSFVLSPLSSEQLLLLEKMLASAQKKCNTVVEEHIKQAEEQADDFKLKLKDNEIIQHHLEALQFFFKYGLINDADVKIEKFKQFVERSETVIANSKRHKQLEEDSKLVYDLTKLLNKYYSEMEFKSLAKTMIEVEEAIINFKQQKSEQTPSDMEAQAKKDLTISGARRLIEDIVTDLQKDKRVLNQFCYELLKRDPEQKHCREILNGQVKPSVLVDIILSNQWSVSKEKMVLKSEMNYQGSPQFAIAANQRLLTFHQASSSKAITLSSASNAKPEKMLDARVDFLLTPQGFQIQNRNQILATKGERHDFNPAVDNQAIAEAITAQTPSNALWTLVPIEDEYTSQDMPYFTLQLSQGEQKPKLVRCQFSKKVFATTKDQEGYSDLQVSMWNIFASRNLAQSEKQ